MAGSLNKVCLIGNLGADPETKNLNSGQLLVNLRVATSEQWKDKNTGEKREKIEWHRVVIWNENLAKIAANYLRKGSKVYLEGQLQTRKWQDQQGQDRYSTEVVLQGFNSQLVMLGDAKPAAGDDPDPYDRSQNWGQPGNQPQQRQQPRNALDDMNDKIPF